MLSGKLGAPSARSRRAGCRSLAQSRAVPAALGPAGLRRRAGSPPTTSPPAADRAGFPVREERGGGLSSLGWRGAGLRDIPLTGRVLWEEL